MLSVYKQNYFKIIPGCTGFLPINFPPPSSIQCCSCGPKFLETLQVMHLGFLIL